ncbi:uncharacterized protein LOC128674988 isoform X3 [Plodia interpunctella]|uniref:uncharacterized protein LOC128674988 isoform X3 n=1 Tax=Plodia interpunctella TaxID=58824 RepID=UPI002367EF91|nr:uncharacterized protein LOC128674988 isoform X3 [Plodia interpunctella]
MAGKSVSFNANCNLYDSHLESLTKWLSCNGEVWGVGPTAVFASAAALFLYNELESTILLHGDHVQVSPMEKTLVSTMVLGMLALMIHLWVCTMRFFQYYLDTLIRESPNILLEMTTAGLLGGQEVVPLGPLTKFLKQQQPQIHITVCWFLSLCYADYVRKHYCTRFNMPYLEQWQTELHERATASAHRTMRRVHSFVESAQQRLRGFAQPESTPSPSEIHTESPTPKRTPMVSRAASHVSWGEGCCGNEELGKEEQLPGKAEFGKDVTRKDFPGKDSKLCARLVSQSSETTVDAIEKLRMYINATRCPCPGAELPGKCGAEKLCSKEKEV